MTKPENQPKEKIDRKDYESDLEDPRLAPNEKCWLNARSAFASKIIRRMRAQGCRIPKHNVEFIIGCAAPFRGKDTVTAEAMREVIEAMVDLYIKLGHFNQEHTLLLKVQKAA